MTAGDATAARLENRGYGWHVSEIVVEGHGIAAAGDTSQVHALLRSELERREANR